jgi:hypothetical protein
MTNREALLAQTAILKQVPTQAIEFQLANQGLVAEQEYDRNKFKELELALAGLILWVITMAKSESELDYSITRQDAGVLLALRRGILSKYGLPDELSSEPKVIVYKGW